MNAKQDLDCQIIHTMIMICYAKHKTQVTSVHSLT